MQRLGEEGERRKVREEARSDKGREREGRKRDGGGGEGGRAGGERQTGRGGPGDGMARSSSGGPGSLTLYSTLGRGRTAPVRETGPGGERGSVRPGAVRRPPTWRGQEGAGSRGSVGTKNLSPLCSRTFPFS